MRGGFSVLAEYLFSGGLIGTHCSFSAQIEMIPSLFFMDEENCNVAVLSTCLVNAKLNVLNGFDCSFRNRRKKRSM